MYWKLNIGIIISKNVEAVNPPFICWLIPETRNFSADGKVYFKSDKVDIELYTDEKDFELEERVEAALDAADLFWQKSEQYIKIRKYV